MVIDRQTNFVYLSPLLEKVAPQTFSQLIRLFERDGISFGFLPHTKDVWVVDFMPIQVEQHCFVQFKFDPDYYKGKKYEHLRSDPYVIWDELGWGKPYKKVEIKLDGGNVVKGSDKVIMTTQVFKDNPDWDEQELINEIRSLLQVRKVIVIPREPREKTGHADSIVRFIDDNTVLINQYPDIRPYKDYGTNLRWSLKNAGLDYFDLPYLAWENEDEFDATGCYMNFLEVGNVIYYPLFSLRWGMATERRLKELFPGRLVVGIHSDELAKHGGVLNCATWPIYKI